MADGSDNADQVERPWWPLPPDESMRSDVVDADEATLEERLGRYRFVFREFGPPSQMLLIGGVPAMLALHELQRSFIAGNFLATVLTAQVLVEHSLGGSFVLAGDDSVVNSGFAGLIDESLRRGWLSPSMAARLHVLRSMRNPYTHPKVGMHARGHMARMRDTGIWDPYVLAETDAREAIRIVVDWQRECWRDERLEDGGAERSGGPTDI